MSKSRKDHFNFKTPVIMHISGPPASGKTTLGQLIEETFGSSGVIVIDTDEFIHGNLNSKDLSDWVSILDKKFTNVIKKHSDDGTILIIFVGVLENFGPKEDVAMYELKHVDVKFYLHIPTVILIQQFYRRICEIKDIDYWKEVSAGILSIPSSDQMLQNVTTLQLWHIQHEYQLVSVEDIMKQIKLIISTVSY